VFSFLHQIVNNLVCWIETAAIFMVNTWINGVADLFTTVLATLPPMPTLPSVPSYVTTGFEFGAYWFPVSWALTLFLTVGVLWFVWYVVQIPLRWLKASP